MEEKKTPTPNEIFAEQISLLHKINNYKSCAVCNDKLYLGFHTLPDGTIQLWKCFCATWGPTEYSRIQDHLHNIDANHAEQMKVIFDNVQKMANYLDESMKSMAENQSAQAKSINNVLWGCMHSLEAVHRNTFWGGIKFGIGIVMLYVHDGWMFLKRGVEQLKSGKTS